MKSFKQMRNEEFVPKFQRATKTDAHYTGTINGKTYVVPHSFHGNHDVLHGTKVTPIRYNHVVSPHHVQFNNPTLSPEEIARVNQHIKDIHPGKLDEESYFYHMGGSHQGQYVTAKSESEAHKKIEKRHGSKAVSVKLTVPDASKEDQLKEESITENILYEKGNYTVRSHPKGHFEVYRNQGTAAVKCATIGKGPGPHLGYERAKAEVDKRHQEEQLKETRQMTLHLGVKRTAAKEVPVTKVTEPEHTASYDELFNSRKAATLAFAKKHHITEKEDESKETAPVKRAEKDGKKEHHPDTNKSKWLKRLFPHSPENRQGFLPEKVEDAMLGEGKNVFDYHQTQIAKKTLRMPDAMVGVMGGMDKEESRRHLKKMGWSDQRIKQHENAQFVSEHVWNVTDHLGNKHEVEAKDRSEAMQKTVSVGSHSHPEGIPMHLWSKVRVEKKEKSLEESKMQNYPHVYDVHLHGKKIDTLRTATHLDPTEYKKMLVQAHDYHPEITVTKKPTLMSEAVKSVLMNEKSLLQEKTLTPAESEKKEDIVHGMKKSIKSFKSHYGERAKNVMYATATARAKELSESRKIVVHHVYDEQKRVAHSIHATAADAKETKKQLELGGAQKGRYTINKYLRKLEENYKYDNMMYATATKMGKKLAESKYGYEPAMTSRLPAHLTDDPKGEKELEQGHLQHCGKCGRVRVFTKGSMTCPVCGTKKVTEEVEQIDELSKNTLGSYVRGAARNKDLLMVKSGNMRMVGNDKEAEKYQLKSFKRTKGIRRAVEKLEEVEQIDELSRHTLSNYIKKSANDIDYNVRHVGTGDVKTAMVSKKRTQGIKKAADKLSDKVGSFTKLEEERKPYDAYDFAVGAKLSHHVDDNTHFHMNKEHGVYHIKGFKQGKHFWDTARTHGEAMKKFSAHKKGVSEEVEQLDEISLGLAHKVHDARIERGDEYQRQAVSGPHHNQAQAKMKQEYAKADKVGGFITRKHNRLDAVGPEGRRGTAYAPTYKFHEEAEQLDEMTIGAGSHKVIKAFLNKQSASSKKLSTDGKTLHGNWLGGSGIAHHGDGKVHLNDLGGKTALQVHRAIKKHLTYDSHSDVPHYDTVLHEHSDVYKTVRRVLGEKVYLKEVTHKIVQKKNHNAVYASGFHSPEHAHKWLANYNPDMWMEKNVKAHDLEVIEDKGHNKKRG